MRQLLLRVPDELHARLAVRAAREGRSVNALANEVLGAAATVESPASPQSQVRMRAATLGVLATPVTPSARPISAAKRASMIAANAGAGAFLDAHLSGERERL